MKDQNLKEKKKTFSLDWLIGGVLTKIGDTFDRLTGRGYKPSSSLATSELIERLKQILDSESEVDERKGKFVPHNIKLKIQWDKFSADSDEALQALENELHIAAIDHINDQRYHTYAPINIEIKPDYFTEGVKLLASFDKFDEDEREIAVNVTVPDLKIKGLTSPDEPVFEEDRELVTLLFNLNGKPFKKDFVFELGERKSVGRTKENDLVLNHTSVSKIHAAFVFNSQSKLMLADTGSTNGTFINDKRIAYGRAFPLNSGDTLKFGTVEVKLELIPKKTEQIKIETEKVPELKAPPPTIASLDQNIQKTAPAIKKSKDQNEKVLRPNPISPPPTKEQNKPRVYSDDLDFSDVPDVTQSEDESNEDESNSTRPGIVLDFGDK